MSVSSAAEVVSSGWVSAVAEVVSVVVSAGVDSPAVVCASVSFGAVVASVVCSVEATVVSVVEAAVVEDAVVSSGGVAATCEKTDRKRE